MTNSGSVLRGLGWALSASATRTPRSGDVGPHGDGVSVILSAGRCGCGVLADGSRLGEDRALIEDVSMIPTWMI